MTAKLKKPRPSMSSKKKKSPSNSRPIPEGNLFERFKKTNPLVRNVLIISFLFTIALLGQAIALYSSQQALEQKLTERQTLMNEKNRWEQVVGTHPQYRDGYFMIAALEYQLGDSIDARKNVEKVLAIDPNFEPGRTLGKILGY